MKKLVIFGSGGHAKVIFSEVMKLRKFQFLGFVDDFKIKGELVVRLNNKNFYNLGNIKQVINDNKKINGIIGVGLNRIRKKIVKDINKIDKNFKFKKIVSKDAIVNSNVSLREEL